MWNILWEHWSGLFKKKNVIKKRGVYGGNFLKETEKMYQHIQHKNIEFFRKKKGLENTSMA